jgi:hypothetical protein
MRHTHTHVLDLFIALLIEVHFTIGRENAAALGKQPLGSSLGEEIVHFLLCE